VLDYTLVSPRATYRMPTPRDVPAIVRLAQAFHREIGRREELPAEHVMATLGEMERNRERGSLYVFERDGEAAGYAILVPSWSNELGGMVVAVDEIYVAPAHRRKGVAGDFLGLLVKVAPQGVAAIQVEVDRSNRAAVGLYKALGYRDTGRRVLTAPVGPALQDHGP
jgi:diamine N-acetyltransferase